MEIVRCLALRPVLTMKKRPDWHARAGELGAHPCPAEVFYDRRSVLVPVVSGSGALERFEHGNLRQKFASRSAVDAGH